MPLVACVPDERDTSARAQHAVDLAQRLVLPEPVERLADRHRVDGAIDERYALGCTGERRDLRNVLLELTPHLEHGLDGDQGGTARDE